MYISTRGKQTPVTASQAIYLGMAPSGGLYVPERVPKLSLDEILEMKDLPYPALAERILSYYLDDYSPEEIREATQAAYGDNFFHEDIVPVSILDRFGGFLELYHGPTAAFKDVALQLTPRLLSQAMGKGGDGKELLILVATSGDTGKAALEGFKDIPGMHIACFFPDQGVSKAQELQMRSTSGGNTHVFGVKGNFDDCQTGVKAVFNDDALCAELAQAGWQLSSANSINWGRLCPQIVYYFYGYLSLVQAGYITMGHPIHYVVPTGNFGNILSAWYAMEMGLPIGRLICASNDNRVLTDFFATGCYDRKRVFFQTSSPSMDILISSNLERFIFEMNGHDTEATRAYMEELSTKGEFTIDEGLRQKMQRLIWAGSAEEREAAEAIHGVYESYRYLIDTHTAVGVAVYQKYKDETGDAETLAIMDAPASPFKFSKSVLGALRAEGAGDPQAEAELEKADEQLVISALAEYAGVQVHPALDGLDKLPVLHEKTIDKAEIKGVVEAIVGRFGAQA